MGLFSKKTHILVDMNDIQKTLHKNLEFVASEQYRLLRTNIQFTIPEDTQCAIIGVTSAIRGEGKSTTSVNLAYVLAEKGRKTLLIDGDLRIPSIAKKMRVPGAPGLTDMLLGKDIDLESLRSEINEDLYILPAGEIPPNPSELLGSNRMRRTIAKLKEEFQYIIIDLPPVNIVSDAVAVSDSLTGMIIVIREEYATKKDVEACFRQIKLSGANVLGIVMNESEQGGATFRRYGKYRRYRYYKNYKYKSYEKDENGSKDD